MAAYLHGPGIDEPIAMLRDENRNGRIEDQELFIYTKDHLGSVKDITDITGNLIQRYHYSAYGVTKIEKDDHNRPAKIVENPYAYTSREYLQELGMYYYRARYYLPGTGRWLSLDPIGFAGKDTNFYRFVANNPINRIDPSGKLSPLSVGACTIILAAGGAYDLYSTIKKGVEIQEKYENKINKINNEQKACSSSNKLKLEQEKMKLLNEMQMESMANAATAYLPGVGSAAAAGACLLMLATF